MNSITDLTPQQLRKAADLQEKIGSLQTEFTHILRANGATGAPRKREFSAAAKARMRQAQRARWAKINGTKPAPKQKSKMSAQGLANIRAGVKKRMAAMKRAASAPRRKMSAAVKARLSALAKARWKKAKAAGKATL